MSDENIERTLGQIQGTLTGLSEVAVQTHAEIGAARTVQGEILAEAAAARATMAGHMEDDKRQFLRLDRILVGLGGGGVTVAGALKLMGIL